MKNTANVCAGLILVLIGFGVLSDHLINRRIVVLLILTGVALSLIALGLIFKVLFSDKAAYRARMRAQGKSPLAGILAIIVMIPGGIIPAIYLGIPAIVNQITGEHMEVTATVYAKPLVYRKKWCNGSVHVVEFTVFTSDRICGLQQQDWEALKNGDKLTLIGRGSIFGFKLEQYKIISSHPKLPDPVPRPDPMARP